ncbi:MAG: hypothetical protein AAFW64_08875 [Pseudomonadota bacterium]
MSKTESKEPALDKLEAGERSLVLSFLSLSERKTQGADPMDELAEAIALRAAFRETPN